jgi:tetratricopeptide (TPR) repeat protein
MSLRPKFHSARLLRAVSAAVIALAVTCANNAARGQGNETQICRHMEQPDAAITACTQLIDSKRLSHAELAGAYIHRGMAQRNKRQFDAALQDEDAALRLDPQSNDALTVRGTIFTIKQQPDAAIHDLDAVLGREPNRVDALAARAAAHGEKQEYEAALRDFDHVLQLDPRASGVYHERAMTYRLLGRHDLAFPDFETAVRLAPDNPFALTDLASCYFMGLGVGKDRTRATELLGKAAQMGFPPAKELLTRLNQGTP